jgi:hypothetical protein
MASCAGDKGAVTPTSKKLHNVVRKTPAPRGFSMGDIRLHDARTNWIQMRRAPAERGGSGSHW